MKNFIVWIYLENLKLNASAIAIFIFAKSINKGIFSIRNLRIVSKRDSACFLFGYFREEFHKPFKEHFLNLSRMIRPRGVGILKFRLSKSL